MRGDVLKLIYVSQPNSTFNFSASPQNVNDEEGYPAFGPFIFLARLDIPDGPLTGN